MDKAKYKLFIYTFIMLSVAIACKGLASFFSSYALGAVVTVILFVLFLADFLQKKDIGYDMLWTNISVVVWNILNFFLIDIIGIKIGGTFVVNGATVTLTQTFGSVWLAIYSSLAMIMLFWFAFRLYLEIAQKKYLWVETIKGIAPKKPRKTKEEKNKKEVKRGILVEKPANKVEEKTPLEQVTEVVDSTDLVSKNESEKVE